MVGLSFSPPCLIETVPVDLPPGFIEFRLGLVTPPPFALWFFPVVRFCGVSSRVRSFFFGLGLLSPLAGCS